MNPLLADPPAASGQPPASPAPPTSPQAGNGSVSPYGAMQTPPDPARACKSCGAQLAPGQEWCLHCGAAVPGSLTKETDWRPLAVLAVAGAILLAGAGTAAYAALNQAPGKPPTHLLIAQVPAPTATAPSASAPPAGGSTSTLSTPPATTTPGSSTPSTGGGAFGTTHSSTGLPLTTVKPPKLPAVVPTPAASNPSVPATTTPSTPLPAETTPATTPGTATEPSSQTPNPILLDTDAASTYNPSGYPASFFGDPGLAIDGETGTAWTAQVEPKVAPLMAAGLALDMKTPHRLGTLEVDTSTPGVTVEVFGANGSKLPATITDPAWTKLTPSHLIKKKTATIKLGTRGKAFRFIVLWLTKAPAASVGTATAPGRVSIGEVVPYPPATS